MTDACLDAQAAERMARSRKSERDKLVRLLRQYPWVLHPHAQQQDALLSAIMAWAYDDPPAEDA